jgi:hypothetical protein
VTLYRESGRSNRRDEIVACGPTIRTSAAEPYRYVLCSVTNPDGQLLGYATYRQTVYPNGEFDGHQVYSEGQYFIPDLFREAFQDWQRRVALQLQEYTNQCGRAILQLNLLRQVHDMVADCSEASEQERVLRLDAACLMGAILKNTRCCWPKRRPIVQLLKQRLGEGHAVFDHVKVEA